MAQIKTCRWDLNDDDKDSGDEKIIIKKRVKIEAFENLQMQSVVLSSTCTATLDNCIQSYAAADSTDCGVVNEGTIGVDSLIDSSPISENDQRNSPKRSEESVIAADSLNNAEFTVTNGAKTGKTTPGVDHNPLHHGCRSVDEYIRLNFIDQGTYGVVFRAKCKKSGRIYALKQVKIGKEAAKVGFPVTALRETNILLALRHPNIVR